MESKEGQSHVLSQSSCDDMRQIRGEHSKKGTRPDIMTSTSRYVERILDTRFEVTRTKMDPAFFDINMELGSYDMYGNGTPFAFDGDIHVKIGTTSAI